MRFAMVDNQKVEATPKLKGICFGCGEPVTAKCGRQRIWHWAHKANVDCDRWWERETEWHRAWKNMFPVDWQEIRHLDQAGTAHIADVKTSHGLVIEFQHSHLDPQEREIRERFYGNIVWVVDGTRLKKDYPKLLEGVKSHIATPQGGYYLVQSPPTHFPAAWLNSKVPVIFDYRGTTPVEPPEVMREVLWCLLPGRAEGYAVVIRVNRDSIVAGLSNRPIFLDTNDIISKFTDYIRGEKYRAAIQANQRFNQLGQQRFVRGRRSRRF